MTPEEEMKKEKKELMFKISKEGHSFPHGEFCSTCQEDFDDVFSLGVEEGKRETLKIIKESLNNSPLLGVERNLLEKLTTKIKEKK